MKQGAYVNYWTAIDDETGHYREDVFEFGLKYAATKNYPELCDLLLEHPNIDVNMKEVRTYNGTYYGLSNSSGSWNLVHTPLILAVQYGHSEIVKRLVKAPHTVLKHKK